MHLLYILIILVGEKNVLNILHIHKYFDLYLTYKSHLCFHDEKLLSFVAIPYQF